MSVSSLGGVWGFGPQAAKDTVATAFYAFRALQIRGGVQDMVKVVEPEVGGPPLPDGAFKQGVFAQEQADIYMRLEDDIGWLLYALTGDHSVIADAPESGLYTHIFRMDPTSWYTMLAIKWLTTRRVISQPEHTNHFGAQSIDSRVQSAQFNFNAAAALTARINLLGRKPTFSDDVSSWTWAAGSPEGFESTPVAANTNGWFKIPEFNAETLPTQQAQVTIGNVLTQPMQEFIIGSPFMDDIANLYRNIGVSWVYKWRNEDFYLWVAANGGTGAEINWSCVVPIGDFEVKMATCQVIEGFSNPYSITVKAPKVYWFPTQPPDLSGLKLVSLPVQGVVANPDDGSDPFVIEVVNQVADYVWPTP